MQIFLSTLNVAEFRRENDNSPGRPFAPICIGEFPAISVYRIFSGEDYEIFEKFSPSLIKFARRAV